MRYKLIRAKAPSQAQRRSKPKKTPTTWKVGAWYLIKTREVTLVGRLAAQDGRSISLRNVYRVTTVDVARSCQTGRFREITPFVNTTLPLCAGYRLAVPPVTLEVIRVAS